MFMPCFVSGQPGAHDYFCVREASGLGLACEYAGKRAHAHKHRRARAHTQTCAIYCFPIKASELRFTQT